MGIDQFRKDTRRVDGYQYRCKSCVKLKTQQRYTESYHIKAKESVTKRRKLHVSMIRDFIINSGGCIVCGECDPVCIDFHHLDPTGKEFNIAQSASNSWENIEKEISKCVMLCANHHRCVHWGNLDLTLYLKD